MSANYAIQYLTRLPGGGEEWAIDDESEVELATLIQGQDELEWIRTTEPQIICRLVRVTDGVVQVVGDYVSTHYEIEFLVHQPGDVEEWVVEDPPQTDFDAALLAFKRAQESEPELKYRLVEVTRTVIEEVGS